MTRRVSDYPSFYDFLMESPVSLDNDWDFKEDGFEMDSTSELVMELKYKKISKIKKFDLYLLDESKRKIFVFGELIKGLDDTDPEKLRFQKFGKLILNKSKLKMKEYKDLYEVEGVVIDSSIQGEGYARELYSKIVKSGIDIVSDGFQYFGARKLWSKISRDNKFIVDVIDDKSKTVIKKNVELIHGKLNKEFEKEFYSDGEVGDLSKMHIRFIMTETI